MPRYFKSNFVPLNKILFFIIAVTLTASSVACAQSNSGNSDALFEAMQIEEGSWVADIGSGDGDYTIGMASLVGESGRIFAVDIDEDKLQELRKRLKVREVTNVSPIYSIPGDPMLPLNSLDAILVRNAYHEFRNYMSMLQHMKRALKPGGRLVMAEPIQEEMVDASREEQAEEHDIAKRYALEDLKEAGFRIVKEVDQFSSNSHQRYWLIIAERPVE
jgi:ubiquinone/menaquinone biosynthesis C-methylase UbiE